MTESVDFNHDRPDRPYFQVGPFVQVVAHMIATGEMDPVTMPDIDELMAQLPPKLLALWAEEDLLKGLLPPDGTQ